MKKVGLLVVAAAMLLAIAGLATRLAYAQSNQITVPLYEQNGSGESGTAVLTEQNGQLMVQLNLANTPAGVPQPAHIHEGTCADLNPTPKYPLNNVVDGASTTTVAVTLADLTGSQAYAINVHKSAAEAKVYVACGDISTMTSGPATGGTSVPGMPTTGSGDWPATLLGMVILSAAIIVTGVRMWMAMR